MFVPSRAAQQAKRAGGQQRPEQQQQNKPLLQQQQPRPASFHLHTGVNRNTHPAVASAALIARASYGNIHAVADDAAAAWDSWHLSPLAVMEAAVEFVFEVFFVQNQQQFIFHLLPSPHACMHLHASSSMFMHMCMDLHTRGGEGV